LKVAKLTAAVFLLSATLAVALPQSLAQQVAPGAPTTGEQVSPATVRKSPQPKTPAEYDAYKAASALTDATKLEVAATEFAQKFPSSELRSVLFQQAMGLYGQVGISAKALEMARTVLKYDPGNAVALLTAGQILAEYTHDSDLDRNDRLAEADADARSALQNAAAIAPPNNLPTEQFAAAMTELRGTAHEVIATVAFKKQDYFTAIKEFNLATDQEKEHTDAVVWLRLSVALDKSGDYSTAATALQKAIDASQPGSQVRQLAEQEKSRLDKLSVQTAKPTGK